MSEIIPEHANWRHNKFQNEMSDRRAPIEGGGGGGHDGGMESRIAALEVAMQYAQRDIAEVRVGVAALQADTTTLKSDVATIKERLSHMPTTLAMWTAVAAVVLPVGVALAWIVQQYLGPLLEKAAGG